MTAPTEQALRRARGVCASVAQCVACNSDEPCIVAEAHACALDDAVRDALEEVAVYCDERARRLNHGGAALKRSRAELLQQYERMLEAQHIAAHLRTETHAESECTACSSLSAAEGYRSRCETHAESEHEDTP